MSRKVSVHHFVANMTTTQYGPHPTSNLLGVDYWHEVPADTEFPRTIGKMDLFTRFYLRLAKPIEFYIRVWWLDNPAGKGEIVGHFGPYLVNFRSDESVRDHVFRIFSVCVRGVGLHAIRLLIMPKRSWQPGRFNKLAETHFRVER